MPHLSLTLQQRLGADTANIFSFFLASAESIGLFRAGSVLAPYKQLEHALQASRIEERIANIPTSSPNAAKALSNKFSALEDAQKYANYIEKLPNGNVRYYEAFRSFKTQESTVGARFVREYNPSTGDIKMWNENYDASGNINRIHLKNISGIQIDSLHYLPTLRELQETQVGMSLKL